MRTRIFIATAICAAVISGGIATSAQATQSQNPNKGHWVNYKSYYFLFQCVNAGSDLMLHHGLRGFQCELNPKSDWYWLWEWR